MCLEGVISRHFIIPLRSCRADGVVYQVWYSVHGYSSTRGEAESTGAVETRGQKGAGIYVYTE